MELGKVLSGAPTCEVIDLDEEYRLIEWNENVKRRLKEAAGVESERNLDLLMKWYLLTLKDNSSFNNLKLWKLWMLKHIKFFKYYLMELNCLYLDNYLSNMENILVYYFEIELKSLTKEQPNGKPKPFGKKTIREIYSRLIKILHIYLLGREDHTLHVLLKIKYELSRQIVMFMNFVYGTFLTKDPTSKSDLAFCRAYLLFEKWKKIRFVKSENKEDIEIEIFFCKLYGKSPQTIREDKVLQKILFSNTSSILDILALNCDDNLDNLVERYFNFIASGNIQEGEIITEENRHPQSSDDEIYDLDNEEDDIDGEFERAYNSMNNNSAVLDTIEIPDDDDNNDEDCQIVEEVISFHDISDDEDSEVIFVPNKQDESLKESAKDTPVKETEVTEIIDDDNPIILEDTVSKRLEPVTEKSPTHLIDSENLTCKSPIVTPSNTTIDDSNQMKEILTVVHCAPEKTNKLGTSRETRTDFVNQIDGLPTPTGSEDRNNEDPMSFIVNRPLVYTPILPAPVIDSDSETDNSKNDNRSQSPTTSQTRECHVEETQGSPVNAPQVCRDETQVSTSENKSTVQEKSNTEDNTVHIEKDMSPDSSEDATRSSTLNVNEKIMYTHTQKLKKMKDVPDYSSFMNGNSPSDDAFVGQVEGRLNRTSMDQYSAIAENFNLYESQDDSLSDNNVSSSNYVSEPSDENWKNKTDKVVTQRVPKQKKKITLCEAVTTTDDSKPRSPALDSPKGTLKGILKTELFIRLRSYNIDELKQLQKNNEISVQKANMTFPKFSFFMLKYDAEKEKLQQDKYNIPANLVNYNDWRDQNSENNHSQKDSTRYASTRKEDKIVQEGMVTSNNNNNNNRTNKFYHESSISNQCENFCCCSGLSAGICTLNISHSPKKKINLISNTDSNTILTSKSNSPSIMDNPFVNERRKLKKRKHSPEPPKIYDFCSNVPVYDAIKTPDTMSPNINLDISFVSIVENFDKESTDFTLDLNPVILEKDNNNFDKNTVSELEEFDSNKLNESIKTSSIPQDLYNLNLQKFSPSPIINCLSPQSNSPSHNFIQENNCAFTQQNEESNIDLKNQLLPPDLKSLDYPNTICNYNVKNCETVNPNVSPSLFNKNDTEKVNFDESDSKFKINIETENKQFESMEEDNNTRTSLKLGDVNVSTDKGKTETRLPLKKRKLSVVNNKGEEIDDEDYLGPDLVEEIIRRARAEKADKEDISYPAKPMISIAEIQDKLAEQTPRIFKTPAEKKEMPPPPPLPSEPVVGDSLNVPPKVVTEQYNNLTYNNPTIYYHMNNVPYPFFPCGSLPYFPSFIVPMNSTTTIDMNVVPKQEQFQQQQQHNQHPTEYQEQTPAATPSTRPKREKKSRGRKKHN